MKKVFSIILAVAALAAIPAVASASSGAHGKVKLAIVQNSFYERGHGRGFEPSNWQALNCTSAYTSTVRWDWADWIYTGGKRDRCLPMLIASDGATGITIMKIEGGYWTNVMQITRGNPCFARSYRGQPRAPWGVLDDIVSGLACPADPGWQS